MAVFPQTGKRALFIFFSLVSLFPVGARSEMSPCSPEQEETIASLGGMFTNRKVPVRSSETVVKRGIDFVKSKGVLTIGKADQEIKTEFLYYRTTHMPPNGKAPLVFVYSGIGGVNLLDRALAHYYTKHGISVVVSYYMDDENVYDLKTYAIAFINTMRVNYGLVDYFSTVPEVDADKFGLVGISYGGIRGSYQMAMDPRVKAGVLMVAGSPLEEILAYSELEQVKRIRARQMAAAHINDVPTYLATLKKSALFSVRDLSCKRKTDDYMLFISNSDTWVPTPNQWNLFVDLGRPMFQHFQLGHVGVPIWVSLSQLSLTRSFFQARW